MKKIDVIEEKQNRLSMNNDVDMEIDSGAIAQIMSLLTNQYSYPFSAVLREYTSNAFDAIVGKENGHVNVTIDLTQKSLIVEDNGIGITEEGLKKMFGSYGFSTKRDTNEQIGGFGIGSKSALAISKSFMVVSRKNGIENTVVVSKDEENEGHLSFLPSIKSDAESGTKVIIDLSETSDRDLRDLVNEAQERVLFGFGKDKLSLNVIDVNGDSHADRKTFEDEIEKGNNLQITDKIVIRLTDNNTFGSKSHYMIGNVYYEGGYSLHNRLQNVNVPEWFKNFLTSSILQFDIGYLQLSPSRESIVFNKSTDEKIEKFVIGEFNKLQDNKDAIISRINQLDRVGLNKLRKVIDFVASAFGQDSVNKIEYKGEKLADVRSLKYGEDVLKQSRIKKSKFVDELSDDEPNEKSIIDDGKIDIIKHDGRGWLISSDEALVVNVPDEKAAKFIVRKRNKIYKGNLIKNADDKPQFTLKFKGATNLEKLVFNGHVYEYDELKHDIEEFEKANGTGKRIISPVRMYCVNNYRFKQESYQFDSVTDKNTYFVFDETDFADNEMLANYVNLIKRYRNTTSADPNVLKEVLKHTHYDQLGKLVNGNIYIVDYDVQSKKVKELIDSSDRFLKLTDFFNEKLIKDILKKYADMEARDNKYERLRTKFSLLRNTGLVNFYDNDETKQNTVFDKFVDKVNAVYRKVDDEIKTADSSVNVYVDEDKQLTTRDLIRKTNWVSGGVLKSLNRDTFAENMKNSLQDDDDIKMINAFEDKYPMLFNANIDFEKDGVLDLARDYVRLVDAAK